MPSCRTKIVAVAASLLLCCAEPALAQVGGTTNGGQATAGSGQAAGSGLESLETRPGMPPTYPQMRNTGHHGGESANAATAGSTVAASHEGQKQLWSQSSRNSSGAAEDARRGANTGR